jgi:hypothetical protein
MILISEAAPGGSAGDENYLQNPRDNQGKTHALNLKAPVGSSHAFLQSKTNRN